MLCQSLLYSKMTQLYTYIHSFLYSFPLWLITGYWIQFPVLCSRTLLFIHPIYNGLHLPTPNSQTVILPCHSQPWQPQVSSLCLSLFLFCRQVYLCHILDFYSSCFMFESFFSPFLPSISRINKVLIYLFPLLILKYDVLFLYLKKNVYTTESFPWTETPALSSCGHCRSLLQPQERASKPAVLY